MPEMQEFLSFLEKLRVGVPQRTPRQLARFLADIDRTHYVPEDVTRLREFLVEVIFEVHGPLAVQEFLQEFHKRTLR